MSSPQKEIIQEPLLHLASLTEQQRVRVFALEALRQQQVALEEEMRKEISALDDKFRGMMEPLIEKRSQVVRGELEPTDDDLKDFVAPENAPAEDPSAPLKGIPHFWLHTFLNCNTLVETAEINPHDHDCLKALVHVHATPMDKKTVKENDVLVEKSGFALAFHFAPNEFFTNEVLKKEYFESRIIGEETIVENITGTKIDWKQGKNLTVKLVKKKAAKRGKRKIPARVVEKEQPSFFTYFNMYPFDTQNAETAELIEADYSVGNLLREQIIPQAYQFFVGAAMDDDDLFGDYDEDEDEDEEEGDD